MPRIKEYGGYSYGRGTGLNPLHNPNGVAIATGLDTFEQITSSLMGLYVSGKQADNLQARTDLLKVETGLAKQNAKVAQQRLQQRQAEEEAARQWDSMRASNMALGKAPDGAAPGPPRVSDPSELTTPSQWTEPGRDYPKMLDDPETVEVLQRMGPEDRSMAMRVLQAEEEAAKQQAMKQKAFQYAERLVGDEAMGGAAVQQEMLDPILEQLDAGAISAEEAFAKLAEVQEAQLAQNFDQRERAATAATLHTAWDKAMTAENGLGEDNQRAKFQENIINGWMSGKLTDQEARMLSGVDPQVYNDHIEKIKQDLVDQLSDGMAKKRSGAPGSAEAGGGLNVIRPGEGGPEGGADGPPPDSGVGGKSYDAVTAFANEEDRKAVGAMWQKIGKASQAGDDEAIADAMAEMGLDPDDPILARKLAEFLKLPPGQQEAFARAEAKGSGLRQAADGMQRGAERMGRGVKRLQQEMGDDWHSNYLKGIMGPTEEEEKPEGKPRKRARGGQTRTYGRYQ